MNIFVFSKFRVFVIVLIFFHKIHKVYIKGLKPVLSLKLILSSRYNIISLDMIPIQLV